MPSGSVGTAEEDRMTAWARVVGEGPSVFLENI